MGLVIFLAAGWVLLVAVVVSDFAGIWRRGKAFRWQGAGLLIGSTVTLVDAWAEARGGPYPRTPLHSFTWPLLVTGFTLFLIGLRVQSRESRRKGRRN